MNPVPPLWAFDVDTIKIIVALVLGGYWFVNYLRSLGQPAKTPPVVRRPVANRPADVPAPKRPKPQESLASEIEQFLQDAAQRKRDRGRRPPVKVMQVPAPQPQLATEAEVLSPPTGEAVSDSVERHLDTGGFALRANSLTEDMECADAEREEHRKKTFDRQIGSLTDTSRSEPSPSAAGEAQPAGANASAIANLLAKPESVRQAIVLNEILNRPEDRW